VWAAEIFGAAVDMGEARRKISAGVFVGDFVLAENCRPEKFLPAEQDTK
jgi:hypothetical protein